MIVSKLVPMMVSCILGWLVSRFSFLFVARIFLVLDRLRKMILPYSSVGGSSRSTSVKGLSVSIPVG